MTKATSNMKFREEYQKQDDYTSHSKFSFKLRRKSNLKLKLKCLHINVNYRQQMGDKEMN